MVSRAKCGSKPLSFSSGRVEIQIQWNLQKNEGFRMLKVWVSSVASRINRITKLLLGMEMLRDRVMLRGGKVLQKGLLVARGF
jgi:hypothetical protein